MGANGSVRTSAIAESSNLTIFAKTVDYRPGTLHDASRIWLETNCYADLWAELLHALQLDPVPAFACALSTPCTRFTIDSANWRITVSNIFTSLPIRFSPSPTCAGAGPGRR